MYTVQTSTQHKTKQILHGPKMRELKSTLMAAQRPVRIFARRYFAHFYAATAPHLHILAVKKASVIRKRSVDLFCCSRCSCRYLPCRYPSPTSTFWPWQTGVAFRCVN